MSNHTTSSNPRQVSVLFITSAPDRRDSTLNLARLVRAVDATPGARASVWYLRAASHQHPLQGSRVIDRLRTWPPNRVLDATGLGGVSARIRGLRLRRWLAAVRPDVVVLDDGLGHRVIEHMNPTPAIAVRVNREPPEHLHLEPPPLQRPNLVIVPAGWSGPVPDGPQTIEYSFRHSPGRAYVDPAARRRLRLELGLDPEATLVVGWGDDGWLDGPDLFIRSLWALEHRHGIRADGVWFGLGGDPHQVERLEREARRCGLGERMRFMDPPSTDARFCGDAALLPYRSTTFARPVIDVAFSAATVVVSQASAVSHPLIAVVEDLDTDAAAAALAAGLSRDLSVRTDEALRHFDAEPLVRDLLALGRPPR